MPDGATHVWCVATCDLHKFQVYDVNCAHGKGPNAIRGQRRSWSGCTLVWFGPSLSAYKINATIVDEQGMPRSDCTSEHDHLDLRRLQIWHKLLFPRCVSNILLILYGDALFGMSSSPSHLFPAWLKPNLLLASSDVPMGNLYTFKSRNSLKIILLPPFGKDDYFKKKEFAKLGNKWARAWQNL